MKDRYWGLISLERVCGMDMGATASLSPHTIWIGNSSLERLSSQRGSNLQKPMFLIFLKRGSFTLICLSNKRLIYETDTFPCWICWGSPYWPCRAFSFPHFDNLDSKLNPAVVCQIFHPNLCHPVYMRLNWTLGPSMNSIESKIMDSTEDKVGLAM